MTATLNHKILPYLLSILLVLATMPAPANALLMYQEQPAPSSSGSSGYSGQGAPMSAQELQSLVAPIALYPDALVAQLLSAATYPDQIAVANAWMQQNKNLTGSALGQAVNGQSWDPSVKALTQFPSVLNNLAQNMVWTSQLGEAYHNQSSDVMAAIQTLRAQAKAAGNLKSGAQITVVQQSPQTIVIQPTNPQVVYVPEYNPTVIYGTPYVTPGYSTGDMVATSLLSFGAGMAVGAMMSGGCCGWGWSNWNCNWYHGGGAYYGNHPYYGNDAWHGGYYDGNHPYNGYNNGYHPNGYNASGYHPNNHNSGYNHTGNNTYNRNTNVSGNTVNANRNDASNSWNKSGGGWESSDAARGYGSEDTGSHATAFSGYGDHSGSSFGSGGWGDRSASSRGWGSQGGGGGWGGGHVGGGGGGGRR
ncbi:MAG TPA: DUF3300 domain-containing protein [Candidatus Limnocylindrales bacterium]|jgi:uncharacterized membrane protein YgcG|nr:DUF3300 domain-containing protein [Candidatus Limnocylindrales bacterium]